jgi:hypothetical protein
MKMFPLSIEERNSMLQIYSDFHKDAYGYRPRFDYRSFSDEQLVEDFATFERVCEEEAEYEAKRLECAIKACDELIDKTVHMGAGNRATALRWIVDGFDHFDVEYILWELEIFNSDYGRELGKEIEEW